MELPLEQFNKLSLAEATSALLTCCTSTQWAQTLANKRPFTDMQTLLVHSDDAWTQAQTDEGNLLEAFDGHPQIGNVDSLKEKYRNTQSSAAHEQSGANDAEDSVIEALAQGNQDYLDKFGFIFIVFATGKSAQQMLDLLLARLPNDRQTELKNAANEQNKITRLRLQKMLSDA
ncbi:2-oxo-4-hydroxy-4-carboxy-5-ureidoimidazoline decarboxylase [Psychrobacter sp.]|uniref:2-oxo-4-hydroxy-4-carboxy-5-ureidoimidazoline decarboxylase n=1 Tax=Psychrobacter sp. TaxID=56811 RepID=UPI0026478006|nr:2-oxo-4-hydroxy-4-carboxy-5-ureidoimidazoline decarboxylase [Psychrobacter sp.]MDN6275315.1 2-oxo-4-hydroxy-4-carboxy-5-ureidoimidazoline decarboxylase [Psychrobacter sp.]MDN6308155.1 2-oxo-4-hydroxy-4-carboxy-5-ureidoimidazoline decarboxylase [Psychrobacter sp.]